MKIKRVATVTVAALTATVALTVGAQPAVAGTCPGWAPLPPEGVSGTVTLYDAHWFRWTSSLPSTITMQAMSGNPDLRVMDVNCITTICYLLSVTTSEERCIVPPGTYNVSVEYYYYIETDFSWESSYRLSAGFGAPFLGCDDGVDNDGDGQTDSADPGCDSPSDPNERGGHACDDGRDNDGDGQSDYPAEDGCYGPADDDEVAYNACSDGVDNDRDGLTDYPSDAGCASWSDSSERGGPCDDGVDTDRDGLADSTDPGCAGPGDASERGGALPCDDGVDNDGDNVTDYPDDSGCRAIVDPNETTIP